MASAGAAARLVDRGAAEVVAVTMGMEGAVLVSATGLARLPDTHVRERSAVGAGDSFLAAMIWPFRAARRRKMRSGAAAVMTCATELCRHSDVEELYRSRKAS